MNMLNKVSKVLTYGHVCFGRPIIHSALAQWFYVLVFWPKVTGKKSKAAFTLGYAVVALSSAMASNYVATREYKLQEKIIDEVYPLDEEDR